VIFIERWRVRASSIRLPIFLALIIAFELLGFGTLALEAQSVTISTLLPKLGSVKTENGVYIHYAYAGDVLNDAAGPSAEIWGQDGVLKAQISVLASFPEAKSVSIRDISASPGLGIAVAAVFSRKERHTKAALLYYDWDGRLTRAVGLDPAREIERLELTTDGSVWALLDGAGDRDPETNPVVVVFRGERIVKSFFNWTEFPNHAYSIQEGPESMGIPGFGVTESKAWFWLPGYDAIIFDHDGGNVEHVPINLPGPPDGTPPIFLYSWHVTENGKVLAAVNSRRPDFPTGVYAFDTKGNARYLMGPSAPGTPAGHVAGFDGSDIVFVEGDAAHGQMVISRKR
jgi:hypothetical protein